MPDLLHAVFGAVARSKKRRKKLVYLNFELHFIKKQNVVFFYALYGKPKDVYLVFFKA